MVTAARDRLARTLRGDAETAFSAELGAKGGEPWPGDLGLRARQIPGDPVPDQVAIPPPTSPFAVRACPTYQKAGLPPPIPPESPLAAPRAVAAVSPGKVRPLGSSCRATRPLPPERAAGYCGTPSRSSALGGLNPHQCARPCRHRSEPSCRRPRGGHGHVPALPGRPWHPGARSAPGKPAM
jgi:hypothetical protein